MKKILLYAVITIVIIIVVSLIFGHLNSREMAPGVDDTNNRLIANIGGE